jgi:hypothetical protein
MHTHTTHRHTSAGNTIDHVSTLPAVFWTWLVLQGRGTLEGWRMRPLLEELPAETLAWELLGLDVGLMPPLWS